MKFADMLDLIMGLPGSIRYNIKFFGVRQGMHLPVLFGRRCSVHVDGTSRVEIQAPVTFAMIKIGVNAGSFQMAKSANTSFHLSNHAHLVFQGKANVNKGSVINIERGDCRFGANFTANSCFLLSCEKRIVIGDDVLFGWNCTVIDGDGHAITDSVNHKQINQPQAVRIGNHVWIAAKASILKGGCISDDSVVGYGSIVTRSFEEPGIVIAGNPAKKVKGAIDWVR